jgi:hypothetical protein
VPAKIDHLAHPANPFFVFLLSVGPENSEDAKNRSDWAVWRMSSMGIKGMGDINLTIKLWNSRIYEDERPPASQFLQKTGGDARPPLPKDSYCRP